MNSLVCVVEDVTTCRHVYELETKLIIDTRQQTVNSRCSLYHELKAVEEVKCLRDERSLRRNNNELENEMRRMVRISSEINNGRATMQQTAQTLQSLDSIRRKVSDECRKYMDATGDVINMPLSSSDVVRSTLLDSNRKQLKRLTESRRKLAKQLLNQIGKMMSILANRLLQQQQQQQQQQQAVVPQCSDTVVFFLMLRGLLDAVPHLMTSSPVTCQSTQVCYGQALATLLRYLPAVLPLNNVSITQQQLD